MLYNEQSLLRLEKRPFKRYERLYMRFKKEPIEALILEYYHTNTGKVLDLYKPKTYNEKLQWLKVYWYDERASHYTDKLEVKQIIKSSIDGVQVIPTLACYDTAEDIDFSKLPEKFVVKATHGSGFNLFVNDKSKVDINRVRKVFKHILNVHYGALKLEWNYNGIRPRIIVEPLMPHSEEEPIDYKFYCFHGRVEFVEILNAYDWHNKNEPNEMIVDRYFKRLHFSYSFNNELIVSKPFVFDKMVQVAEYVAKQFPHVRIDLYNFGVGGIYWGECTFFPSSGYGFFTPEVVDLEVGSFLDLETINKSNTSTISYIPFL